MTEGIYLKCDPYIGWSVVVRDTWGSERQLVNPTETLEEALRRAAIATGQPHYLKLTLE